MVSQNDTKPHKLLFHLFLILIDLNRLVYSSIFVFLVSMAEKIFEKNNFAV